MLFLKKTEFLILASFAILANWSIVLGGVNIAYGWTEQTNVPIHYQIHEINIEEPNIPQSPELEKVKSIDKIKFINDHNIFNPDPGWSFSTAEVRFKTGQSWGNWIDVFFLNNGTIPIDLPWMQPGMYEMQFKSNMAYSDANGNITYQQKIVDISIEVNQYVVPNKYFKDINDNSFMVWSNGNNYLDKPFIMVEGIDAKNNRHEQKFFWEIQDFLYAIQAIDPDVDFVLYNFKDGGGEMSDLALDLADCINWMKNYRTSNGQGNIPSKVIGISMGGVVSRYALAYAEQEGVALDVSHFISVDSPQQGAVIDLNLQQWLKNADDSPLFSIANKIKNLTCTAARQLLVKNAWTGWPYNNTHNAFYNNLNSLNPPYKGFPNNSVNIGISFGVDDNPNIGEKWLYIDENYVPGVSSESFWITYGSDIAQSGSYLPEGTFDFKKTLAFIGVEGTQYCAPTFIPQTSALSISKTAPYNSEFDIAIRPSQTYYHDELPAEIVPLIFDAIGLYPQWSLDITSSNYTCKDNYVSYYNQNEIVIASPPLTVNFFDESFNNFSNRLWNFGNAGTSTLENPNFTFTNVGAENVITLSGNNSNGQTIVSDTRSQPVDDCSSPSNPKRISHIYLTPGEITNITGPTVINFQGQCDLPYSWNYQWQAIHDDTYDSNSPHPILIDWHYHKGGYGGHCILSNVNEPIYSKYNISYLASATDFYLEARKFIQLPYSLPNSSQTTIWTDWFEFNSGNLITAINPCDPVNPSPWTWPYIPVCPHITWEENGERHIENNILHSAIEGFPTATVDRCLIQGELPIDGNNYVFNVEEIGTSTSAFDYFKLQTIDVPILENLEVGAVAQDGQELVFYYPDSLHQVQSASSSNLGNVLTKITAEDSSFFTSDSGTTLDITIETADKVFAKLIIKTDQSGYEEIQPKFTYYGGYVVPGGEVEPISTFNYRNKKYTHVMDVSNYIDPNQTDATFRFTFRNHIVIDQISVDYSFIDFNDISIQENSPSSANLLVEGRTEEYFDQLSKVTEPDFNFAWIDPSKKLELQFPVPELQAGFERKFVFITQGHYATPADSFITSIEIPKGFNLFSLPVKSVVSNSSLQQLFTGGTETMEALSAINYEEVDWVATTSLDFSKGYATVSDASKEIEITGKGVFDYDLSLESGWSLIGGTGYDVDIAKYLSVNGGPFRFVYKYEDGYIPVELENTVLETGNAFWVYIDGEPIEIFNFPNGDVNSAPLSKPSSGTNITLPIETIPQMENSIEFLVTSADSDSVKLYLAIDDSLNLPFDTYKKPPVPKNTVIDSLAFFDAQIYFNDSTFTFANIQDSNIVDLTFRISASSSKFPVEISWLDSLGNLQVSVVDSSNLTKPIAFSKESGKVNVSLDSKKQSFVKIQGLIPENKNSLPLSYSLSQNYPNPFNPSTRINYSIPENSFVKLEVFNILGRKVKTLVSDTKEAGFHSIKWNGLNDSGKLVSSGVYFYRLQSNEFIQTKKMLFLK